MSASDRLLLLAIVTATVFIGLTSEVYAQKRVGVVAASVSEHSEEADAFRTRLRELGYVEGRDISISWWHGHGSAEYAPEAVNEFLKQKVDVLVVESTRAGLAAKRGTNQTPIVMALVGDPVEAGLVESLGHPGGNITGLTNQSPEVATKRLQLLHEALPDAKRVAVPFNPGVPYSRRYIAQLEAAALVMKLKLTFLSAQTPDQLGSALARISPVSADVIMPIDDAFMTSQGATILERASKVHLPLIYAYTPLTREGALLSYAVNHSDLFRRAAGYVEKIFNGIPPGNIPVEQPTKFVLAVNLKSAKALGLTIPNSILLQADEVIR
jgi:putative ABC transport system substrate-binding protein